MTFADLMATTPAERWASLPVSVRDAIGAKLIESHFAELVRDDDGLETTEAEREQAAHIQDEAFNALFPMIEAAFPSVLWCYPEGYRYEARDDEGSVIGTVDAISYDSYQFTPTSDDEPLGPEVEGTPQACLPENIRKAVADGGWFGAVFEDGRRYPDDFRATLAPALAA